MYNKIISLLVFFFLVIFSGCDKDDPIYGCTDILACNYSESATDDDESCIYPQENFNCEGECVIDDCTESSATGPSIGVGWNGNACSMPQNSLHITSDGNVLYNTSQEIGGFQWTVDGTTVSDDTSDGAATDAGFTLSVGNNIVIGFSLTANSIPVGCGTLINLTLGGVPFGLIDIIISNPDAQDIGFTYFNGIY